MRVLLIEDHPVVRAGCRRLLQDVPGLEILEAATATEGLRQAREDTPDIVVLDLKLPDASGLDLIGLLAAGEPAPGIIVFSMYEDPAFVARAMDAGANGYLSKNDDPNALLAAVEAVAQGRTFLSPLVSAGLAQARNGGDCRTDLSGRETEIVDLLAEGRTLGQIAHDLGISYRTSANLAAQVKGKLGLESTAALIKWAVERAGRPIR